MPDGTLRVDARMTVAKGAIMYLQASQSSGSARGESHARIAARAGLYCYWAWHPTIFGGCIADNRSPLTLLGWAGL